MSRRISPVFSVLLANVAILLVACGARASDEQRVRFDFETGDLQGWHVVAGYFDRPLTEIDRYYHASGSRKQGRYFFSTTAQKVPWGNDQMTGVAESPVFALTGPRISLLVGGGARSTGARYFRRDPRRPARSSGSSGTRPNWSASGFSCGSSTTTRAVGDTAFSMISRPKAMSIQRLPTRDAFNGSSSDLISTPFGRRLTICRGHFPIVTRRAGSS